MSTYIDPVKLNLFTETNLSNCQKESRMRNTVLDQTKGPPNMVSCLQQ